MLLERSVLGLTPLRGEEGWSRAAPQVRSTAGREGPRRGRTGTENPPVAASEAPAPASPAWGLRRIPLHPTAGTGGNCPPAAPPPGPAAASLPALGEPRPPRESAASARRRPALTGPVPSPVPDDLPQQRQRLPRRVLGARPLPAAPQPRREGLDLLRELRAALRARHGGRTSASAPPPSHWRSLPSCALPSVALSQWEARPAVGGAAAGRGQAPGPRLVWSGRGRLRGAVSDGLGKAQFLAVPLFLLAEPEPALDKAGM